MSTSSSEHTVTIAGGGIAALEVVLALRALADGIGLELLAPEPEADYRPLSVLEPFALGGMPSLDLGRFAAEHDAVLHRDTLVAVEPGERTLVTGQGARHEYEILVVAAGARALESIPGSMMFRGSKDQRSLGLLLEELARGDLGRIAFAVPAGQAWSLPVYELALMTHASLAARGVSGVEVQLVTPEPRPLGAFGERASAAVAELLKGAGIALHTDTTADHLEEGVLRTSKGEIGTDRVVSLPRLVGPRLKGLPSDEQGFIPTDEHGLVEGLADVYAAGDVTSFPVKQGGLATQQADAVAEAVAARLGADIDPQPFRPVLRGLLMTGVTAHYLEGDGRSEGTAQPALWAPKSKVFGRYLLPYMGGTDPSEGLALDETHAIHVDLDLGSLADPA